MLLLGVTVSLGLWIIGVDVWLGLGVPTALLTFIPYIGPLIKQRAVHAAPALMISVQVLMGALFSIMGLILAAPLTVVAMVMVMVNTLYVEDVLGEQTAS